MNEQDTGKKACPECGGKVVLDDDTEELVCLECGLVIVESESDAETSKVGTPDKEVTAFESTERASSKGGDTPPETVSDWKMWYPCPVCHSTELNQIVESHLSVSVTEEGVYDGESSMEEYNYIECSNCGEVLMDETGRDDD